MNITKAYRYWSENLQHWVYYTSWPGRNKYITAQGIKDSDTLESLKNKAGELGFEISAELEVLPAPRNEVKTIEAQLRLRIQKAFKMNGV